MSPASQTGRSLFLSAVIAAPPERVFSAWLYAAYTERWWGCEDTIDCKAEIEPRVGGRYFHCMEVTGVGEVLMAGTITALDPPRLLSFVLPGGADGGPMPVSVTFEPQDGGTLLTLIQKNLPDELAESVHGGWSESLRKLSLMLATA